MTMTTHTASDRMMFVSYAVKDLEKSKAFFSKLGFTFNPQFTDEKAASMKINDNAFVMLLVEPFFQSFSKLPISDPRQAVELQIAISAASRADVDAFLAKVIDAGGQERQEPQDHGFMYGRDFTDLDGHCWSVMWMDPGHVQPT
jgi:predicted lactoylglutathione lyase